MSYYEKGKKNKLKVGDAVQMKPERVKWEVEHMCEMNLVGGKGEFRPKDYAFVAGFLHAEITQKMPKGEVVGYGSTAEGPSKADPNKWVVYDGENCVRVEFRLKYGKCTHYYHERDCVKLKKKK
jgi:hypothetical protein